MTIQFTFNDREVEILADALVCAGRDQRARSADWEIRALELKIASLGLPIATPSAQPAFERVDCPDCGSALYVDDSVLKVDRGVQSRVRAALCSGCEFTHEF